MNEMGNRYTGPLFSVRTYKYYLLTQGVGNSQLIKS